MNIDTLSREEKIELLEILEEQKRRENGRQLLKYRPYTKQREFHAMGALRRERLLQAANQCVSPWTFIQTPAGSRLSVEVFSEEGALVHSWDGANECASQVSEGILKDIQPVFRVVLDSGLFFDCPSSHHILTEQGYSSLSQIVSQSSGLRYIGTPEGYQDDCFERGYLCGQQPRSVTDTARETLPSPSDALKYTLSFSREDAEARISQCTNTFQQCDPLTNFDGTPRNAVLFEQFSIAQVEQDALPLSDVHQAFRQFATEVGVQLQSFDVPQPALVTVICRAQELAEYCGVAYTTELESSLGRVAWQYPSSLNPQNLNEEWTHGEPDTVIFYPFETPNLIGGARIISIVSIGYQPIVDATVREFGNYKAGGAYHHNTGKTLSAAAEVAMHLTGQYPDWWEGKRIDHANHWLAGSKTGELTRRGVQRYLLGRDIKTEIGTGMIPAESIVDVSLARGVADLCDTVKVKHKSGGVSSISFKSYDQGREKWQADTVHGVWFDEEPPEDVYFEGLTRTNATMGIVMLTFTPLLGMSAVVRRFLIDNFPGTGVVVMTIDDAEHYTPEQRAVIIASYPAHEREARARGVPTMGSGLIFPVTDESIEVEPFKIPAHFALIVGIDFGWDHPTGATLLAWDKDADIIYVVAEFRARETVPALVAAAIKPWGRWIPVAWPHDGLQHDKGSGIQLKEQYRTHGLNMLKDKATHPPAKGEDEGTGGNGVEAGLQDMYERMMTGRWKVFTTCRYWFEEKRMYHRDGGQVIKQLDDVLASSRYAYMMRRKAKSMAQHEAESNATPMMKPRKPMNSSMGY